MLLQRADWTAAPPFHSPLRGRWPEGKMPGLGPALAAEALCARLFLGMGSSQPLGFSYFLLDFVSLVVAYDVLLSLTLVRIRKSDERKKRRK